MSVSTAYPPVASVLSSYDYVAVEYYDSVRHPTCANFRTASDLLLDQWFQTYAIDAGWICEVGPGRSATAEQLLKRGVALTNLVLVDSSALMLSYSNEWRGQGLHFIQGDAKALGVASEMVDLVVSSLGDPYNTVNFWHEASRVLRPGGKIFFTTPAYEWALAFRDKEETSISAAQFDLVTGQTVAVPSFIYPRSEQLNMLRNENLQVDRIDCVTIGSLPTRGLSSKLLIDRGSQAEIVTGYVAIKGMTR